MLALDVARIEAGLLLIEVDFFSCRKALIPSQQYSPFEMGLSRLVQLDKAPVCRSGGAAKGSWRTAQPRRIVGLEIDWQQVEALYENLQLPPQVPATASRVAVPVYHRGGPGRQSHVDDVVSHIEEIDCAGDSGCGRGRRRVLACRWR